MTKYWAHRDVVRTSIRISRGRWRKKGKKKHRQNDINEFRTKLINFAGLPLSLSHSLFCSLNKNIIKLLMKRKAKIVDTTGNGQQLVLDKILWKRKELKKKQCKFHQLPHVLYCLNTNSPIVLQFVFFFFKFKFPSLLFLF